MNHLAHFFLSGNDDDLAIGNFVADFIKNRELPNFTEGVKRGIFLHRAIDAFTDAHPIVKQSTQRLHPFHHKYSPVIVDVYYDFLLAKNWEKYEKEAPFPKESGFRSSTVKTVNLRDYIDNIYKLLTNRILELPNGLQKHLAHMISDDWLMRYTNYDGLQIVFLRIEKKTTFAGDFGNAAKHLEQFLEEFDAEFNLFFPDLQAHVLRWEHG